MPQPRLSSKQKETLEWIDTSFKSVAMGYVKRKRKWLIRQPEICEDAWQNVLLQISTKMVEGTFHDFETDETIAKYLCASLGWHIFHLRTNLRHALVRGAKREDIHEKFFDERYAKDEEEQILQSSKARAMIQCLEDFTETMNHVLFKKWGEEFLLMLRDGTFNTVDYHDSYITLLCQRVGARLNRSYVPRYGYLRVRKIREIWWEELRRKRFVRGPRPSLRADGRKKLQKKSEQSKVRAQIGAATGERRASRVARSISCEVATRKQLEVVTTARSLV